MERREVIEASSSSMRCGGTREVVHLAYDPQKEVMYCDYMS